MMGVGAESRRSADAQGRTKLVLAFYYAWFDPSSFSAEKTPFQPISPYFSTSESTIRRHIKTAKAAGIDGFVQSWYGPNPNQQTEPNLKLGLDLAQQHGFKMAVDFEVASPFFGGNQDRINALKALMNTHVHHPAYLRVDGKPVIFFWANWVMTVDEWAYIREQSDPWNQAIWIAEGGHTEYLEVFDGLHLYNVAWSSNPAGVNYRWAYETRKKADELGTFKYWVGTAMPGFNNTLVPQPEHTVRERNNGRYLRDSFRGAVATDPDMIVLTSFNEWPEGSHIEPSIEFGNAYIEEMAQLTAAYKGYARSALPQIPVWIAPEPTATPEPTVQAVVEIASSAGAVIDGGDSAENNPSITASNTQAIVANGPDYHVVQPGETLIGIALRYATDVDTLLTLNSLSETAFIRDGQQLLLRPQQQGSYPPPEQATTVAQPTAPPQPPVATSNPFYSTPTPQADGKIIYVVQEGDTLVGIATRFSYTVEQLNELYVLNGLNPDDFLRVGQEILLGRDQGAVVLLEGNIPPRYAGASFRESDGTYVHRVQQGDTLISIAVAYEYETMDAFYEVSGLSSTTVIGLGQEVIVGLKPQPAVTGGSSDLPITITPPPATPGPPTAVPTITPLPTRTPVSFPTLTPAPEIEPAAEAADAVAVVEEAQVVESSAENVPVEQEPAVATLELASAPISAETTPESSSILPLLIGGLGLGLIVAAVGWYLWFGRDRY